MQQSGLADAVGEIDKSTDAIVSSLAEPRIYVAKRLGLVVGNVQSGKKANFSAVIAKPSDEKYRFVIVLSGIHNNLRKQTQERLERDLGREGGSQGWYRLTDPDGDFGRIHFRNAGLVVSTHEKIIAVVKNGSRLQNVLDFLPSVDEKTRKNTPILIVDDESDQATPDSPKQGFVSQKAPEQNLSFRSFQVTAVVCLLFVRCRRRPQFPVQIPSWWP